MNSGEPASRTLSPIEWLADTAMGKHWICREYYGVLREVGRMMVLSISSNDESARHDWRELQQLKNMVVGPEWEGLEIYPAESELIDPSNRFYIWCFRKGTIREALACGLPVGRQVIGPERSIAPQRAWSGGTP